MGRSGLKRGCQVRGFQIHGFAYISGSNRLRNLNLVSFIPKLRSRNPMKPFRTVYDQQGCQICHQGCQFHIFGHISGSNTLRNMILVSFLPKLRSRNPMKPFRTVYEQQGCQICPPGLPDSHFWLYLWF